MLKDEIINNYGNRLRVRACGINIIDNKILLTRQSLSIDGKHFWSPPGGGIEFNETIEKCIKREFFEETGLEINVKNFIKINEHINPPLHAIELFYFVDVISGKLINGSDPELSKDKQSIEECSYFEIKKIKNDEKNLFHPILFQLISKK